MIDQVEGLTEIKEDGPYSCSISVRIAEPWMQHTNEGDRGIRPRHSTKLIRIHPSKDCRFDVLLDNVILGEFWQNRCQGDRA